MFDDNLKDQVKELINEELKSANRKFPLFASNHEACAVMFEEFEEAHEELENCAKTLERLWKRTRKNQGISVSCDALEMEALFLACEAVQLAAMAKKTAMSERARQIIKGAEKEGGENG